MIFNSRIAFWLLVLAIVLLDVFCADKARCATSAPRKHDNAFDVVILYGNPDTYMFGVIVNQTENPNRVIVDGRRRYATILTFQPFGTFELFTESLMFCGNQAAAFQDLRGPVVVAYRTVAHEMVNGVACHELDGAYKVTGQP